MVKTIIEQKGNKYFVVNRLTSAEIVSEREYKAIADGFFGNLIPIHAEKGKTGMELKSSVTGMVPLQSYFQHPVDKNTFLDVISQIISILKECEKNLLNKNNLMLDCEYIFLDVRTKKLKCIYWPVVNNQSPAIMVDFFCDIPFRTVFTKDENHDYVTNYISFFKNHVPFSLNSFERFIVSIKENRPMRTDTGSLTERHRLPSDNFEETRRNASSTSYPQEKGEKPKFCPKCRTEYSGSAKFCTGCGKQLIASDESSQIKYLDMVLGIKVKQSSNETTVLGAETTVLGAETTVLGTVDFEGGTTVLGADIMVEPSFPYLIREKTQEQIFVNKDSFQIGKEPSCDYSISENNAISRYHAEIISRNLRYYVIDNQSTNKTFVDQRAIPAKKEFEIFSGTKLKFANEEFIFYIE